MHVVVPLAGPDFVRSDGSVKALTPIKGEPLLHHTLQSRPWSSEVEHYSFILHDCEESQLFVRSHLKHWYQDAEIVYLSTFTRGAAFSALAGVSTFKEFNKPLIIDLADILYKAKVNVAQRLRSSVACGGLALSFQSQNPEYSYFRLDKNRNVIETAEKRVISKHASAGTYIFRDSAVFLRALGHAIENEDSQTHNRLFYVCPLFNGVVAQNKEVALEPVFDVLDIKFGRII